MSESTFIYQVAFLLGIPPGRVPDAVLALLGGSLGLIALSESVHGYPMTVAGIGVAIFLMAIALFAVPKEW